MLTPTQIAAQDFATALSAEQVQNLLLLVKQYPVYVANLALFPDIAGELALEVATPTIKTQALKAVLAALDELPELVVESQGRDTAPSHFSNTENWYALALDVLNVLYDIPAGLGGRQSFALTSPKVENFLIEDNLLTVARKNLLKL